MTRVIAGTAGGRPLAVPDGRRTRPTGDRVKEALFSSLGDLTDAVVLDLFAGTGGLAIESLSRGAARAVLVEQDRRAVATVRANLEAADVADRARVVATTAERFAIDPSGGPFDVVFVDPPYAMDMADIADTLEVLVDGEALRPGARVVIERDKRRPEPPPRLLSHDRDRTYGETVLRYFTYIPASTRPAATPAADATDEPLRDEVSS
ncbi:16S rRNA (guanine(966)-N(2))-methyltransferase RsmD [Euzebya rosea]|uniref:16S rRNA (guanine(966)-N(2))-methyltransferase RsmD n=1 Tax=Euzebya rosea TaxID=2052804 RepID=UPI000D3EDE0D|nr:16S rRNA (guanine(966)-N(2))-methyltransferase RsmD [Euzebya rosea]